MKTSFLFTRKGIEILAFFLLCAAGPQLAYSQFVGFGEATPDSKVDALHDGATGSTVEATQTNASNTAPAMLVKNSSGGDGMEIQMNAAASTKYGLKITQVGKGSALHVSGSHSSIGSASAIGHFEYTGLEVEDHIAVQGVNVSVANYGIGVKGNGNYMGILGTSTHYGVQGTGGFYGVRGSGSSYGVYGTGATYGVYANGNLGASGAKTFLIDHPLDPAHKYLRHFSVESDEVLNLYRGIAQLDAGGRASVALPAYFQAINTHFSYLLTSIGAPDQPWIVTEIDGNQFVIGGAPHARVSWIVMAQRNDAYIQAYPLETESLKEAEHQGKYLRPELFGQPESQGVFSDTLPASIRQPAKP